MTMKNKWNCESHSIGKTTFLLVHYVSEMMFAFHWYCNRLWHILVCIINQTDSFQCLPKVYKIFWKQKVKQRKLVSWWVRCIVTNFGSVFPLVKKHVKVLLGIYIRCCWVYQRANFNILSLLWSEKRIWRYFVSQYANDAFYALCLSHFE